MHYLGRSMDTIWRTCFSDLMPIWVNFDTTAMQIMQGRTNTGRQHFVPCGRNSSLGKATRYGLEVAGIETRWERDFCTCPDRPWGLPSLLWVPGLSRGKAAGTWRWPPTPSNTKVKERVELHLYFPSGPSWPVLGWPLPFYLLMAPNICGSSGTDVASPHPSCA